MSFLSYMIIIDIVWSSDNEFISNDYISDIDFYLYNILDENIKLEINDIDIIFH